MIYEWNPSELAAANQATPALQGYMGYGTVEAAPETTWGDRARAAYAAFRRDNEVATFLVLAALSEAFGYPVLAKMYHQRIGTFASIKSRTITFDVRERFWALDAILDKIVSGTEAMRAKIAAL